MDHLFIRVCPNNTQEKTKVVVIKKTCDFDYLLLIFLLFFDAGGSRNIRAVCLVSLVSSLVC